MELATIQLPAYLFDPSDATITLVDNRRYTMRDIGQLEDRVENLETLTSLSLLELDTRTLQIRDADGLDRFKSGFFVDDFADSQRMSSSSEAGVKDNELGTPVDYASFKPEVAAETPTISPQLNLDFGLIDPGVQKTGDLITLKYSNKQWITQPLASRVENVNPFNMVDYVGQVTLSPAQDTWTRTVTIDGGTRFQTVGTTGAGGTFVSFSTRLESILPDTHIRSRNVAFDIVTLRPLARYYSFFDSSSNLDIIPKLTEITMTSGVFQAGETVKGFVGPDSIVLC